ncbi:hypothetical protein GWE18_09370 [Bradyrhizobium sp. CSA112]|uniref:hypothetical protein n=1 Tax=Bradyrhizobium sp. CSA112 TaxID=2699170 RepID=UPI0023B01AC3|nr:hypothetical protein [Bradyrhizobium sp. CSA112]MDE5453070.1 hypothetical protein [Bradyrhizobium sp. CSA112]
MQKSGKVVVVSQHYPPAAIMAAISERITGSRSPGPVRNNSVKHFDFEIAMADYCIQIRELLQKNPG